MLAPRTTRRIRLSLTAATVLVCVYVACPIALAQEQGPVQVNSQGVTISFQNSGGNATVSRGVTLSFSDQGGNATVSRGLTISFNNQGGNAVTSNGTTISFANAQDARSNSGVTIGFGNPPDPASLLGHAPHSGFNADPVNTATGNYVFERTDLSIPGRGIPFEFKRSYNSQDSTAGTVRRRLDALVQHHN